MRLTALLLTTLLSLCSFVRAADDSPKPEMTKEQMRDAYTQQVQSLGFKYTENSIKLPSGTASLNLPPGYRYISPDDARKVVVDLWGNPPDSLRTCEGMVVPKGEELSDPNCWAIVVTNQGGGYISDKDADTINYDELLEQLQKAEKEENEQRTKAGYATLTTEGWALPPHYDKEHRVLYWAKHLSSSDGVSSLNYDVRVLGRRGLLSLNAVAGMSRLNDVQTATPEIVAMAKFDEGHRYADFNPKTDEVSKIGLAGLVLGGAAVAAKTGLFKVLGLFLLKAWKLVAIGVAGIGAGIKKLFGRKDG